MKAQSSLELLITVAFGLIILIPVVALALLQVANSTSTLTTTQALSAASKLAAAATSVGSEGAPAKQEVVIDVPQSVSNIYVGTATNGLGHEIIFVVNTNAGPDYISAYSPVNITGSLQADIGQGTYLVNVSAQARCPLNSAISCVYLSAT
jgi:hypothetical protein